MHCKQDRVIFLQVPSKIRLPISTTKEEFLDQNLQFLISFLENKVSSTKVGLARLQKHRQFIVNCTEEEDVNSFLNKVLDELATLKKQQQNAPVQVKRT